MDARDFSERIFKLWQEKYPKNSGDIHKSLQRVPVAIWTEQGYREVVGAHINELGFIEIVLDDE